MKAKYEQIIAKYQHMKAKLWQIKAKYQQLNVKYEHNIHVKYMSEQIYAKHLQRFDTITWHYDIIVGDISDDLRKQIKNKIPDDPTKTMGLYSVVSVATAAKYDLTTNIDVTDGLTNGAECVIQK